MPHQNTAIDLFAGAGGASEGLEQAGFDVISANEINPHASLTYKYNHPNTNLLEKDIRKLSASELVSKGEVALLFAGLPCQGFSNAGKKKTNDKRNYLFKEVIRLTKSIRPRFVMIENVAGLLAERNKSILASIEMGLIGIGYTVSRKLFDTSELGVPQKRRRILILASQDGLALSEFRASKKKKVSVKDAIGDLEFLDSGSSTEYMKLPRTRYQKQMREGQKELWNHQTSTHSRKVSRRFSILKEGEVMRTALPRSRTKKIYAIKLKSKEPAPTLTTLPDDYIHYALPRSLTVREMARLQSFRDSYVFLGPRTTGGKQRKTSCPQYTQVGNAVPPMFMKEVGTWLLSK